jgi:hypothetical protein
MRKSGHPRIVENCMSELSSQTFRIYGHHGSGGAATPGGKLNRLLRFMNDFDADIYAIGHVHDVVVKSWPRIGANNACDKLIEIPRIGIVTGSYLRTYTQGSTGYGEVKGYSPVPLGAVAVEIEPHTRKMGARI